MYEMESSGLILYSEMCDSNKPFFFPFFRGGEG